jgi:sigma-B regulation protein RsbU (phosphoserine phosphatase)
MIRAFLVDDEPPARARMRQLLAEAGDVLIVGEASNADDARGAIVATQPDVVFLDIEMPERRGTELAASLPEPRPFIVFATAFDRYAIDAFAVAATDYLLKPITRGRLAGTLARVREQLSKQTDLEREMAAASTAQAHMLTRAMPAIDGFDCAADTVPARAVGGDFYLAQRLANGRFVLALGDVSGKGVPAGLVASSVQARLETMGRHGEWRAADAIGDLNRALTGTIESARFATLAYVELQPSSDELLVVNAGHPSLIAVAADGACDLVSSTGPALGVLAQARYQAHTVTLEPGAVLVAYSDGVTEAVGEDETEFGEARLAQAVASKRHYGARQLCRALVDEVRAFRCAAPADDVTVMVIKRLGPAPGLKTGSHDQNAAR